MLYRTIIAGFLIMLVSYGCTQQPVKSKLQQEKTLKPENAGYLLVFTEMRPNEPESTLRMIITDKHMRIDEGPQSEDYILFDRSSKVISNVVAEDESIMVINPGEQKTKAPFPLRWIIESQTSQALMRSDNSNEASATHFLYYLNDKPCYNLVTIDNHLVATLDAMREYNLVLANELKRNYREMDAQQCYEAINIFDPNLRLQNGFPLREWSSYGYQRFLVDFKNDVIFPKTMFELPTNYKKFKL